MTTRAAKYAALFERAGRRVTLERPVANAAPLVAANVRARLWGASAEEVAAGIKSSTRHVLILAADVPVGMLPLRAQDAVKVDGLTLKFIERPDDQSHRDGETLLAIKGLATGS